MSLSKVDTKITALPVDVISLVFEHLPLVDVLRSQSLVCKVFYEAHRQHCRSSVKHLTLIGHYMIKSSTYNAQSPIEPQSEVTRKIVLYDFARSTGSPSCPTINPSTVHLKLIAGLENAAYEAIGSKFKSITHLELYQLALERHYKPIAKMLTDWGSDPSSPSQLTDLKIFFNKEIYATEGYRLNKGNNSCCFAYILSQALTPEKAPALRQLTIVPGNKYIACKYSVNHRNYCGPLLEQINLSQVQVLNASDFDVIDLPYETWSHFTALEQLTIGVDRPYRLEMWTDTAGTAVLSRLSGLTIFGRMCQFIEQMPVMVGAVGLRRLSLIDADLSLSTLIAQLIVPLTAASAGDLAADNQHNGRLEELCVRWRSHQASKFDGYGYGVVKTPQGSRTRFTALTRLHLEMSYLLHRAEEMTAISAFFPNLTHLRLDGNHTAANLRSIKLAFPHGAFRCLHCCQHVWDSFLACTPGAFADNEYYLNEQSGDVQRIASSTAATCKAAFVRQALAAWPKLTQISLQIDDFFRDYYHQQDDPNGVHTARLKCLYLCETLNLRDSVTGELLPEEAHKWTVEKVLY